MEFISIVTPMYNGGRFVAQTIESVLAQTYPHWEMLIVDDGSKDDSPEIVGAYSARDPRIKLGTVVKRIKLYNELIANVI